MKGQYSNMDYYKTEMEKQKITTPTFQQMSYNSYYAQQYTPNKPNFSILNPGSRIPTFTKQETPVKPVETNTTTTSPVKTNEASSRYQ